MLHLLNKLKIYSKIHQFYIENGTKTTPFYSLIGNYVKISCMSASEYTCNEL